MNHRTKLAVLLLIGLVILIIGSKLVGGTSGTYQFTFDQPEKKIQQSQSLENIVSSSMADFPGTYAVYIKNPTTEEFYIFNSDVEFYSASLYKLVVMAATFEAIEQDGLLLNDTLSYSKQELSNIFGEVDYGYVNASAQIVLSVEEALTRIGRISDNFAAIMLSQHLRTQASNNSQPDPIIEMTKKLGMSHTIFNTESVTTNISDIGHFFELLYRGEVVSKEASDQIIKFLSLSQINDRLPANLPEDVKVVHKTGELPRLRHDGGIVYLENNPYIIVVMSKDLEYEDQAIDMMADLSRNIYDYFSKTDDVD